MNEFKDKKIERGLEKIADAASGITEQLADGSSVNVIVAKDKYQCDILNPFAMIFCGSFLNLINNYDLTKNDIKTVLQIIYYARFGNLIQMSYAKLAKDLGINRQNLSRTMKKLRESGIIIEDDGNMFLNPQIISKGSFAEIEKNKDLELIEKGAEALANTLGVGPNVITKSMKDKAKTKVYRQSAQQASLLD